MFNLKLGKPVSLLFTLILLASCNQQEFFEKEFLEGVGVPDDPIAQIPVPTNPTIPTDPTLTGPSNPTNGGDNPGGSTPGNGNPTTPTAGGPNTPTNDDNNPGGPTPGNGAPTTPTAGGPNTPTNDDNNPAGPTVNTPSVPIGNNNVCSNGVLTDATDRFVQNTAEQGKVDILWVIDNSGSMRDEQESLARNFNAFAQSFIQRQIDFQMAVTTTDPRSSRSNGDGRVVGGLTELTLAAAQQDEAKFLADFSRLVQVGVNGSGNEQGLNGSQRFFERNNSWLREEAFLVVVYVSDEQDHSPLAVQSYVDGLRSLKKADGLVSAYSIITTELNAQNSVSTESVGTRYIEVAGTTGGQHASIHADFHETLSSFGGSILNLLDTFPLSGVPLNAEIEITVNNTPVTSGWTYDPLTQVIRFDEATVPNAGSIVIAFYQRCVE